MTPRSMRAAAIVAVLAVASAGTVGYLLSTPPPGPCAGVDLGLPSANGTALAPVTASPAEFPDGRAAMAPLLGSPAPAMVGPIPVVAAENFWGSLVGQLGGNQTSVLSVVSDPNADPHEYEANNSVARAFATAELVLVNGVGYDDWALQLVAADGNPDQIVLNVGVLNGVAVGGGVVSGNPHLWYNPVYVNRTVAAIYADLVGLRPSAVASFAANYHALNGSLGTLYAQADALRAAHRGAVIAATEDLIVYLADYAQLNLVSPPAFMLAVAEGGDPPFSSVVQFQCQLESGQVRVLVYNAQTVTPLTTSMEQVAVEHHVVVVPFTETIQPQGASFQSWMASEYAALAAALDATAGGG